MLPDASFVSIGAILLSVSNFPLFCLANKYFKTTTDAAMATTAPIIPPTIAPVLLLDVGAIRIASVEEELSDGVDIDVISNVGAEVTGNVDTTKSNLKYHY